VLLNSSFFFRVSCGFLPLVLLVVNSVVNVHEWMVGSWLLTWCCCLLDARGKKNEAKHENSNFMFVLNGYCACILVVVVKKDNE
jgi:hypothetical protein